MSSNNGFMTIQEASVFSGLAISTLYKAVQRGILPIEYDIVRGKKVKKIKKTDIVRTFNILDSTILHDRISDITPGITQYNTIEYDRISDIVKENIKKVIEDKQSQLMKPLEEQALFISGKLTQENLFLKAKVETLLQELEQYKALPGPAELETKENTILLLQKEKEEQIRKAEGLNQVLLDNANNIKELAKEKDNFQSALKEQEATIREKERALKDLEEIHRAELEQALKQAEEEKKQIAEIWKKELEQAKRPWYKFW